MLCISPMMFASHTVIWTEIVNRTLSFSGSVFTICINFTINDDNIALQTPEEHNLVLLQPEDPQLLVERNSTRIIIIDDDGTQNLHSFFIATINIFIDYSRMSLL